MREGGGGNEREGERERWKECFGVWQRRYRVTEGSYRPERNDRGSFRKPRKSVIRDREDRAAVGRNDGNGVVSHRIASPRFPNGKPPSATCAYVPRVHRSSATIVKLVEERRFARRDVACVYSFPREKTRERLRERRRTGTSSRNSLEAYSVHFLLLSGGYTTSASFQGGARERA